MPRGGARPGAGHGGRVPGAGRKPGVPNKLTRTIRETFEMTFKWLQQQKTGTLRKWAKENPGEFYKLAARLIPTKIEGSLLHGLTPELARALDVAQFSDDELAQIKAGEITDALMRKLTLADRAPAD